MRHIGAVILAIALWAPLIPAAQVPETSPEAEDELGQGLDLMGEGARRLFRGILKEIEPALDGIEGAAEEMRPALRAFAEQMGPALVQLLNRVDEIRYYQTPELLPNGDIIIRRRPDAPDWTPPKAETAPSKEIDL